MVLTGDVKDWVCGAEVKPSRVAGKIVHEGETYYFCSPICRDKFDDDPERYAARARAGREPALAGGGETRSGG